MRVGTIIPIDKDLYVPNVQTAKNHYSPKFTPKGVDLPNNLCKQKNNTTQQSMCRIIKDLTRYR